MGHMLLATHGERLAVSKGPHIASSLNNHSAGSQGGQYSGCTVQGCTGGGRCIALSKATTRCAAVVTTIGLVVTGDTCDVASAEWRVT